MNRLLLLLLVVLAITTIQMKIVSAHPSEDLTDTQHHFNLENKPAILTRELEEPEEPEEPEGVNGPGKSPEHNSQSKLKDRVIDVFSSVVPILWMERNHRMEPTYPDTRYIFAEMVCAGFGVLSYVHKFGFTLW
ncbi:MAG: hypothetical protein J3Q66DRAFT_346051 [Benniella sp.]|nr:MAG: hypothetical protein J3Q66DRAFT_346051 [Benniella sp.]